MEAGYRFRTSLGFVVPVLRQNSEGTEHHSLTMLQACSQAVDLKVDRHFGEGHLFALRVSGHR